jgi:dephospho-CoA kinase
MIRVGLTGGMGSGKTTVAGMFTDLGVPVYNSDTRAKQLMNENKAIRDKVIGLFGEEAYNNNFLNRAYLAERVFKDKNLLSSLNGIVHPAVREDFQSWTQAQTSSYVIQEAAILFENGGYESFDFMILVTAPKKTRIARIKKRDKLSETEILERMQHQWPDKRKKQLSHFVINNTNLSVTRKQVMEIHNQLTKNAQKQ